MFNNLSLLKHLLISFNLCPFIQKTDLQGKSESIEEFIDIIQFMSIRLENRSARQVKTDLQGKWESI
jgi:hypothetical protein